jgi:hypothetical protein
LFAVEAVFGGHFCRGERPFARTSIATS